MQSPTMIPPFLYNIHRFSDMCTAGVVTKNRRISSQFSQVAFFDSLENVTRFCPPFLHNITASLSKDLEDE